MLTGLGKQASFFPMSKPSIVEEVVPSIAVARSVVFCYSRLAAAVGYEYEHVHMHHHAALDMLGPCYACMSMGSISELLDMCKAHAGAGVITTAIASWLVHTCADHAADRRSFGDNVVSYFDKHSRRNSLHVASLNAGGEDTIRAVCAAIRSAGRAPMLTQMLLHKDITGHTPIMCALASRNILAARELVSAHEVPLSDCFDMVAFIKILHVPFPVGAAVDNDALLEFVLSLFAHAEPGMMQPPEEGQVAEMSFCKSCIVTLLRACASSHDSRTFRFIRGNPTLTHTAAEHCAWKN